MKTLILFWECIRAWQFELKLLVALCLVGGFVTWLVVREAAQDLSSPRAVRVIDGCQYIEFSTYSGYVGITHKGNCTNSIHAYNR